MSAHPSTIIKVLLPKPFFEPFDYKVSASLTVSVGQYVLVPFGRQLLWGVVWETGIASALQDDKIKEIKEVSDLPPLSILTKNFLEWVAHYTLSPLGSVLKMLLSVPEALGKKNDPDPASPLHFRPHTLNADQQEAGKAFREAIKSHTFKPFVLEGVTGSGKTEVYFEGIKEAYDQHKQSLILVPEISLSAQWVERFKERFGVEPTLWHSDLTPKQRKKAWLSIAQGTASVVIGARSALFLPYKNLGYIVVDEEHDHSYKQETSVIYQARDLSVMRGYMEGCPVVLSSATPSLETLHNIDQGKYVRVHLPNRHGESSVPTVTIVDMRYKGKSKSGGWISKTLQDAIHETVGRKEQTLLFLNRRGYSPLLICHGCGHRMECPNCSTWLVYHKSKHLLQCHHCTYHISVPKACPECHSEETLSPCGPGVERIEEEVSTLFPEGKLLVMTSDTLSSPKKVKECMRKIEEREVDIIIGTQVMAKGHHFPFLTLVGVIDGDMGLSGGDLRAAEKTYQLLYQVGGRAGRTHLPGSVLIQTYCPEHPVMHAIKNYDQESFLSLETQSRQALDLPPFGKLAALIVAGKNAVATEQFVKLLGSKAPRHSDLEILGPSPAPLHQLNQWHRWRFLVKAKKNLSPQKIITQWLKEIPTPSGIKVSVDIDPYSFF
jgi:primosomal protein N' (replication factor Y)